MFKNLHFLFHFGQNLFTFVQLPQLEVLAGECTQCELAQGGQVRSRHGLDRENIQVKSGESLLQSQLHSPPSLKRLKVDK